MTDKDDADDKLQRRIEWITDRVLLLFALTTPALFITVQMADEFATSVTTDANSLTEIMVAGAELFTEMMFAGGEWHTHLMLTGVEAYSALLLAVMELYISSMITLVEFATTGLALELLVLIFAVTAAALVGLFVTNHSWAPPMVLVALLRLWDQAKRRRV